MNVDVQKDSGEGGLAASGLSDESANVRDAMPSADPHHKAGAHNAALATPRQFVDVPLGGLSQASWGRKIKKE